MLYDQFLAIDYGTKYIKGVLFKNVLGTASIIRCETLKIIHLEDKDMDDYEYNIIRFIQSFFPEELKFVTNINLDRLYIRDLTIPLTNEKAVKEIIPFEVENKLPFPAESMEVLGVLSKIDEENSYVVTFNVEKTELERLMNPFTKGESRISCLSVDSYALSSIVYHENEERNKKNHKNYEYIGQLDIGYDYSLFNSIHKGRLYHTRSFQLGGGELTRCFQEDFNLTEDDAEECLQQLSPFLLEEIRVELEELEIFKKKYRISHVQWKKFLNKVREYSNGLAREIEKSIYSLIDSERPQVLYLSGGGSKLTGLDDFLSKKLEIPILIYELPLELGKDPSFVQAYATGLHYMGKTSQKIDYLTTDFAKKQNKNEFRVAKFTPHIILTGISLIILLFVFIFGIIIDKRKITQNRNILVERYNNAFGEEPPDPKTIISSAMNKLKQEQKKTEIFRLFLNKESVLDAIAEATEHFPDKDNFQFQLTKFLFQDDEIQIYGKVNEYAEIGTVEQELAKSIKFKDVKVLDKRMATGVNKFKVSFKIRMLINRTESD